MSNNNKQGFCLKKSCLCGLFRATQKLPLNMINTSESLTIVLNQILKNINIYYATHFKGKNDTLWAPWAKP